MVRLCYKRATCVTTAGFTAGRGLRHGVALQVDTDVSVNDNSFISKVKGLCPGSFKNN